MEFKGTKGKWRLVEKYDEMETPLFSIDSDESIIIHCYNLQIADGKQERAKANALLISKAPEMLEMLGKCKEALSELLEYQDGWEDDLEQLEQLIKSATEL